MAQKTRLPDPGYYVPGAGRCGFIDTHSSECPLFGRRSLHVEPRLIPCTAVGGRQPDVVKLPDSHGSGRCSEGGGEGAGNQLNDYSGHRSWFTKDHCRSA